MLLSLSNDFLKEHRFVSDCQRVPINYSRSYFVSFHADSSNVDNFFNLKIHWRAKREYKQKETVISLINQGFTVYLIRLFHFIYFQKSSKIEIGK